MAISRAQAFPLRAPIVAATLQIAQVQIGASCSYGWHYMANTTHETNLAAFAPLSVVTFDQHARQCIPIPASNANDQLLAATPDLFEIPPAIDNKDVELITGVAVLVHSGHAEPLCSSSTH